jgi:ubiquinone/menaquinone biosynthesis C-methylase UbiE
MQPSERLAREYSDKADAYERYWVPVVGPMALPLVAALPLSRARRVLDVGAGTGSHLAALADSAPHARILAVDRAEGMLRLVARRWRGRLAVMDAQQLAVKSASIDVATLIFMLFHLPDPVAGVQEVRRVLKPAGTVGIATWGTTARVDVPIWTEELDRCGADPDPRDPSVMQQAQMDTEDKLQRLLQSAGYTQIRIWSRMFEHHWELEPLVANQLTCGMAARRLGGLSADRRIDCEARVRARLAQLDLVDRSEVLFAVAR